MVTVFSKRPPSRCVIITGRGRRFIHNAGVEYIYTCGQDILVKLRVLGGGSHEVSIFNKTALVSQASASNLADLLTTVDQLLDIEEPEYVPQL